MTVRIGDKVRFLNEVGGGIVSGFKGKDVILVEDEDGFEIPVLITECVVIESSDGPGMTKSATPTINKASDAPLTQFTNKNELEAYIAIAPEFQDTPLQGKMELYIINDSNYFIYYLCDENNDNGQSIADGLLHPHTHQPLGTFTAQELGELGKINVRLMPFMRGKAYKHKANVEKSITFNAVKLSKSKSYVETTLLNAKAILMPIHKAKIEEAVKDLKEDSLFSAGKHQADKSKLKSPKKTSDLIEVDLHIEALLDDFSGMSKNEMLELQLSKFNEVIKENKNKKGQRVVFIHGVGNGRLKTDIRNSLQRKHKLDFQDASFREYGYGATMVIIR